MSSELKEFLEISIQYLNKKIDGKKLMQKYSPNEKRNLLLTITYPEGQVGLNLDENFQLVTGEVLNPTVEAKMGENVFWAIVSGKLAFAEAYFDGGLDLLGDQELRDFAILAKVFNELSHLMKELVS